MKHLKKIMVCIATLLIEQVVVGREPMNLANLTADDFVAQSYISPAMQAPIFALYEKPFIVDNTTGAPVLLDDTNSPRPWPTIDQILEQIGQDKNQRNAAIAVKESIGIAIENARLTFALQADETNLQAMKSQETQVMQDLAAQKQNIENVVEQQITNNADPIFNDEDITTIENEIANLDPNADVTIIRQEKIAELINTQSFENLVNQGRNDKAAQLLCKECFIAQQYNFIGPKEDFMSPLIDAALNKLSSIVDLIRLAKHNHRIDKNKAHLALSAIRKAIQTALFIAQNKYGTSWYNPNRYIYGAHPLIKELQKMDELVRQDLIQPQYGATQADLNREYYYKLATNVALGVIGTAVVIGTVVAAKDTYDNYDIRKTQVQDGLQYGYNSLTNAPQAIINTTTNAAQTVYDTALKPFMPTGQSKTDFYTTRAQDAKKAAQQAEKNAKLAKTLDPNNAPTLEKDAAIKAQDAKIAQEKLKAAQAEDELKATQAELNAKKSNFKGGMIQTTGLEWTKNSVEAAQKEFKEAQERVKQAEEDRKKAASKPTLEIKKSAPETSIAPNKPAVNSWWSFSTSKPVTPPVNAENKNGILKSIESAVSNSLNGYNDAFALANSLDAQEAQFEAARNKIEEGKKMRAEKIAAQEQKDLRDMQQDPAIRELMAELRKEKVIA